VVAQAAQAASRRRFMSEATLRAAVRDREVTFR
jgi:hypothetical protein